MCAPSEVVCYYVGTIAACPFGVQVLEKSGAPDHAEYSFSFGEGLIDRPPTLTLLLKVINNKKIFSIAIICLLPEVA